MHMRRSQAGRLFSNFGLHFFFYALNAQRAHEVVTARLICYEGLWRQYAPDKKPLGGVGLMEKRRLSLKGKRVSELDQ